MLLKTKPNILFVCAQGLDTNSGYHTQWYARSLIAQGAKCVIAVPNQTLSDTSDQFFSVVPHSDVGLMSGANLFNNGRGADLVMAWTPREIVRRCVQSLFEKKPTRLVVHLEDNEEHLTEVATGINFDVLSAMPTEQLDKKIPVDRYHPVKGREFLKQANGITYLVDSLRHYVTGDALSARLSAPVDESIFSSLPINYSLRKKLGISDTECVIVYSGNVHDANAQEVLTLYDAVRRMHQIGQSVRLIRTGRNTGSSRDQFADCPGLIDLGWVNRSQIAGIMSCADLFIQPGGSGAFNDERVPSKLPEYFALGRPVIMSKCNVGLSAQHLNHAYITDCSKVESIVQAVSVIWSDRSLIESLSLGARHFYETVLKADEMALPQLMRQVLRVSPVAIFNH